MPTTTIPRPITQQQAAEALRQQLGSGYKITPHSQDKLTVSRSGLEFATVHLADQDGTATTFHVHGSGLILGRIVNEFVIARTVTTAIKESLGSAGAS
jgi:hypothetical protein